MRFHTASLQSRSNHLKAGFRLCAVVQVSNINDCCYRKQSLHQDFREGQLYPLKLPVESDHCQVTALPCADLVLSTLSSLWLMSICI